MSKSELAKLLQMCSKSSTVELTNLPKWLQDCLEKGMTDPYRQMIIPKFIMANTYFDASDVPLTSQLLKMVMKRARTGKYGNINTPFLLHAMDGLSPFIMLDLNEDQVALLNDEQDLLNNAFLVSVADLCGQQNKLKVSIPDEANKFMLMLKRFVNLLFPVFSDMCPPFQITVKGHPSAEGILT
mmetsp:Transcript_15051/g.17305  ORF Transcript_15051/g.17305 Transcript_15051/m.17305 type:complete len:184 (+) Transcript_15051:254-805(+)